MVFAFLWQNPSRDPRIETLEEDFSPGSHWQGAKRTQEAKRNAKKWATKSVLQRSNQP